MASAQVKAKKAEAKAINLAKSMTIAQLCEGYEMLVGNREGSAHQVRGWLMDELESRNKEVFYEWLETEEVSLIDKPSHFFCK